MHAGDNHTGLLLEESAALGLTIPNDPCGYEIAESVSLESSAVGLTVPILVGMSLYLQLILD